MKKLKMGFFPYGLLLFGLIMIPNLIWAAVPAPQDVLRRASLTPQLDCAAAAVQALMIAALCLTSGAAARKFSWRGRWVWASLGCTAAYFAAWIAYYCGAAGAPVLLILRAAPCLAFLCAAADRRNWLAGTLAALFLGLHTAFALINFVL